MATLLLVLASLTMVRAKVSLYLSSDQTEALYGIQTPGLYYITEGVVNKYAMNFQHQASGAVLSIFCLKRKVLRSTWTQTVIHS